jgi:predicted alpha/beta-hydrolase family hydrolase
VTLKRVLPLLVAAIWAAPAVAGFLPSPPAKVFDLPTRDGVTERYAAFAPDSSPRAAVILFVGGEGQLNIPNQPDANWQNQGNFLSRSREYFRRRGLFVVVVDAPSDRPHGLGANFRLSAAHAEDTVRVIADVRRQIGNLPVWLVGTSRGSISAANVAARLQATAAGLVLTSSVTRPGRGGGSQDTVFDVDLAAIRVPTLIVLHNADACEFVGDAAALMSKLSGSPRKELMTFAGGDPPRSTPCEALAAHGFFGIEERVVNAIADWILASRS